MPEDFERGRQAAVTDYVAKFDREGLLQTVAGRFVGKARRWAGRRRTVEVGRLTAFRLNSTVLLSAILVPTEHSAEQGMTSCLMVDDSRVIRMVARRTLQELEFPVLEAEDGIEFFRGLRKPPGGDKAAAVFGATENDLAHIRKAIEAGTDEYIMKSLESEIIQIRFAQAGL